jgi:hypothetical protein
MGAAQPYTIRGIPCRFWLASPPLTEYLLLSNRTRQVFETEDRHTLLPCGFAAAATHSIEPESKAAAVTSKRNGARLQGPRVYWHPAAKSRGNNSFGKDVD